MRDVRCPVCDISASAIPGGLYHCLHHGFDVFMYCADCAVVMDGECQPCLNRATRAYIAADLTRAPGPWSLR